MTTPIRRTLIATLLSTPVLLMGAAHSQSPSMPASNMDSSSMKGSAGSMDMTFFKMAAIGGMTEVEAGKLAAAQGSSTEVKTFGQKMVDDHMKANDQLKALAAKKGMTLPSMPDAKHQAMLDELKGKQGAAFDTAFVTDMKKGHEEAISVFTAGSKSKDADVAQFASATLPTLKDHQAHIPMAGMAMGKMKSGDSTPAP